jgi:hypothetical protein
MYKNFIICLVFTLLLAFSYSHIKSNYENFIKNYESFKKEKKDEKS